LLWPPQAAPVRAVPPRGAAATSAETASNAGRRSWWCLTSFILRSFPSGLIVRLLETPASGVYSQAAASRRHRLRVRGAENGQREALARPCDQLQRPAGRELGAGRDDDLVGREGRQRVTDREQRIGVAVAALDVPGDRPKPREQRAEARLCATTGGVLVRDPAAKPGVERRRDDD